MSKIRFQAPDRLSYVRSITNQIGPDVSGVATKRTLPTFTDANTIYVAKTGLDTNAGTSASPMLTLGAATAKSVSTSHPYVAIKDSGVYEEIVGGGGYVSYYAMTNCRPTIKYPSSETESYFADAGAITAFNYYGTNEYSLRGLGGTYFTGTINDYQIIDGVHWIASTNGIWYSYIGYTGWNLVAGTAGQNWDDITMFLGTIYARRASVGIFTVTYSGVVSVLADTTCKRLVNTGKYLIVICSTAGGKISYLLNGTWKSATVSLGVSDAYFVDCISNTYRNVDNVISLFVHFYSLYTGLDYKGFLKITESNGALTFTLGSAGEGSALQSKSGYYDNANDILYAFYGSGNYLQIMAHGL